MALTLADVGADCILKTFFNNTRPAGGNNFTLKLFVSNTTPADTDTAATYTVAVGGGYADKTLTNGSFTVTVGNDPSDATHTQSRHGHSQARSQRTSLSMVIMSWMLTGYSSGLKDLVLPLLLLPTATSFL